MGIECCFCFVIVIVNVFLVYGTIQFDSHRTRHGFVAVGEMEQCIHYRVGESQTLWCSLFGNQLHEHM